MKQKQGRNFNTALMVAAVLLMPLASALRGADAMPAITLDSLLREMVDRDAIARWPRPAYTLRQASSHDRHKLSPADPAGWHSNHDYEQFIRTEQHDGRTEWVIMDDTGPGAITRFWLPLYAKRDHQTIRIYFDGSAAPSIAANFNNLLSGRDFVKPPFAFVAWNETDLRHQQAQAPKLQRGVAGDLYLPIPFARGCKITLDELPFYYIVNYRIYEPGADVKTFTMADYEGAKDEIARAADLLLTEPAVPADLHPQELNLALQATQSFSLPAGPAAVRDLLVKIDPKDPAALRSVIVQAKFDDESTVWCPLGELFGAGARLHPVQDWHRSVAEDGTLRLRWIMPYQHSATLTLKNLGPKPATLSFAASTSPWSWDDRSMYFHANWHAQLDMPTRPRSDWNFINITGQGVYAGDTLTVFSPVKEWYGEGDERIFLDNQTAPAHIGTGTEDYYGYAWGMATFFNSPFLSTPRRDIDNRSDWRGYTTTSRLRLLDGIPFRIQIHHDMEIWNWADTKVDYAAGLFWYARPGAMHNREPQPEEAAAPIRDIPPEPAVFKIPNAIECETMKVSAHSDDLKFGEQRGALAQGQWSNEGQLFVQAIKAGDFIELVIPVSDNQPRKLTLHATKSWDYGILKFTVNGQPAYTGQDYDAFHAKDAITSGPIELGTFTPQDGKLLLRVTVTGSNPAAKGTGCYFGLDCAVLSSP